MDLRISGLERDFASRTKSSSTFEDRLSIDVTEGRVTFNFGVPSVCSEFCSVCKRYVWGEPWMLGRTGLSYIVIDNNLII